MTVPTPTRQRMHRTPRAHAHPLSLIAILTAVVRRRKWGAASGTDAVASGCELRFRLAWGGKPISCTTHPSREIESAHWPGLTL